MNEAVLGVFKKVLLEIQNKGINNNQALYISFFTNFKDVVLSESIKKQYPKEITIVLQHQFKDLKVIEDKFSVQIAFKGSNESIEIPFNSITNFLDPIANFGFQFVSGEKTDSKEHGTESFASVAATKTKEHNFKVVNKKNNIVVDIDKFRKTRKLEDKTL